MTSSWNIRHFVVSSEVVYWMLVMVVVRLVVVKREMKKGWVLFMK